MKAPVLVVAKAPVPGLAKTRLAAHLGERAAAELAAASLLDTLDTVERFAGYGDRLVSLTGDLEQACRADELTSRLDRWQVCAQRGDTFAARLVAAHEDAAAVWGESRPVVQIGTDTPALQMDDLARLAAASGPQRVALGPATDGGWWGLATWSVRYIVGLVDVPMSTPDTCRHTRAALEHAGATVAEVHPLTDVDDVEDARRVTQRAPHTRFARTFAALADEERSA